MDEELKEIRKAINEQKENINRERNLKTEKKKKKEIQEFPRLGLCTSTARGLGLIPGQGTKIPQAVWCGQNKES